MEFESIHRRTSGQPLTPTRKRAILVCVRWIDTWIWHPLASFDRASHHRHAPQLSSFGLIVESPGK
jgi:hypothetical protein